MLSDPYLKVLAYEPDSKRVFSNVELQGGVAVTYRDNNKVFGAIGIFTPFKELSSILHRITPQFTKSMASLALSAYVYKFTDLMHTDHPDAAERLSKGHAFDLKSNVFMKLEDIFTPNKPSDEYDYIKVLGRYSNDRAYRWIRRDYINAVENLDTYKVVVSSADGAAGTIGKPIPARIIGVPTIEGPAVGTTESFVTIGHFNEDEARNAQRYLKTKTARCLIGVRKTTQHITPEVFKYVPLQDFTSSSDIDWSQSVADIDRQLYQKYGLSQDEIDFIESHVKEMS